jgi:hypothetical protein
LAQRISSHRFFSFFSTFLHVHFQRDTTSPCLLIVVTSSST